MKSNAFILYDGLVSFVLLASFICFFIAIINISAEQEQNMRTKVEALEMLRYSAYYFYENETKPIFKKSNMYPTINKGSYCINYETEKERSKYCV